MVEVHPVFGAGRFACLGSHKQDTYEINKVKKITHTTDDKFEVHIETVEEGKDSDLVKIDFDEVTFASHIFNANLSQIS